MRLDALRMGALGCLGNYYSYCNEAPKTLNHWPISVRGRKERRGSRTGRTGSGLNETGCYRCITYCFTFCWIIRDHVYERCVAQSSAVVDVALLKILFIPTPSWRWVSALASALKVFFSLFFYRNI